MNESFELQQGTQRTVGGALVGVVGVDATRGVLRVRVAVGVHGDQHRAWVEQGKSLTVPGWGSLEVRDVVAAGRGRVRLAFVTPGGRGTA